ncbi:ABC transporter ATP-binding protein [Holzapfeliella sp. JNUCC 80]
MIKIENLTKEFNNKKIFTNLSLKFQTGKVYALIGASGSGKTTLLNIIGHLEPVTSGDVLYHNQSLKSISSHKFFKNDLGYLFQNFGLLDNNTIKENLDLGLIGQKLAKKERIRKEKQALEDVNLSYLDLNKKIFELSGGEAQRIALAKIILKNPPLILADEPTAALDPKNSSELMHLLTSLKNKNRTIIIATHNSMIWENADEIIDLRNYN